MNRTLLLIFVLVFTFSLLICEVEPVDFEPGLRELTDADWEFLNGLDRLELAEINTSRELPLSVDNSEHEWLRPVFGQDGGSCGQASGIGYCFTYEIDRLRGLAADVESAQYPDHYTWNFLNGGAGGGSWHFDGWQIVKAGGCPTIETYGGMFAYGQTGWMDGYDNYRSAMENRVDDIFAIDVSTEEGLEALKYWFYEHGNEEETGGLVCFGAGVSGLEYYPLPEESPFSGENIITDWTTPVNHAMTFVGYNDSICYDYNGDGEFTNDIDINGDGEVNMLDWEIGAVKMVNSWGMNWGNNGFCWVMYRTLAEPTETGGIWSNVVHGIHARAEYEPLLTLKAEISHNVRNTLRIGAGVSSDPTAREPEVELLFPYFNFQGGAWNLPGNTMPEAQPLEIGLDITPLLSELEEGGEMQWWLIVESVDPDNLGDGSVISYSVINETGDEPEEFTGSQTNSGLINNWNNYFNVSGDIDYEGLEILTDEFPMVFEGVPFEIQMDWSGGELPLEWSIKRNYEEDTRTEAFPEVDWQPIEVTDNDDGWAEIDLPFNYSFYGDTFGAVTLLTDGSLVFDNNFTYIMNEENIKNNRCITAYGADLMAYPEYGDGFYYYMEDDLAMFRWTVSKYGNPDFDADFVIALRQYQDIDFYYNEEAITSSDNWVAGVSMGDELSYEISGISGSYVIPAGEVREFDPVPFPGSGDYEISDTGLFTGVFSDVDEVYNPYQLDIIVQDNHGIYDEKMIGMTISTLPANAYGDIDDNSLIQAYDGSLVLNYVVGNDPIPEIDPLPWEDWRIERADVDLNGTIQAYDAALITNYVVGNIPGLPWTNRSDKELSANICANYDNGILKLSSSKDFYSATLDLGKVIDPSMINVLNSNIIYAVNGTKIAIASSEAIVGNIISVALDETGNITGTVNSKNVQVIYNNEAPGFTRLNSVYPNPFNPETNISFELATNEQVIITVYNVKGQKVANILNQNMSAGAHSVVWNANGKNSGIYFLCFQAGGQSEVKKVILLK
ncbi:MAG: T9SS type A sorting domain-containing protein [Candidatus Stygibacter frigidus]|nr:T9SS type A sorting domain-containing protein [Candidatus Stygibacter frigidus]